MKPLSSQNSKAEGKNSPHFTKDAQTPETKLKGASVQEVKRNVPSDSRAIVPPQHNTNEGSRSKNEEQMRGGTTPPSEHTNNVNTQAEHAVPQPRNEHLLTEASESDPAKSTITHQSDDIKPALETDREKPTDYREYIRTGKDQQDEVKQSFAQVKDNPDVSRPFGISKDQTDDGNKSSEIPEKLGNNINSGLVGHIEQPDVINLKIKDEPGNASTCLGTAKDQLDYTKSVAKKQLERTSRSSGTLKAEPEDVQRPSGIQPDDVQGPLGTLIEVSKEVKKSLGDVLCSHVHMCSESVKDQPDDAKRAAQKQVDNVQRPSGAVIEQPDDASRSVETAKEHLAEDQGFQELSKEQADDVARALETGKVEQDDTTETPAAKEQSDDVRVGSPQSSVEPQPVSSLQHELTSDSLPETTEEPLAEESVLLEKIRQIAEDSDTDTSSLSLPVPVLVPLSRCRKRLIPFQSDFDLPPSPPLKHMVCTTSPELAGQNALPVSEVNGMNVLRMGVTSEEPSVDSAALHADEIEMLKGQTHLVSVDDERKETLSSETNDETPGEKKVLAKSVSAEDKLDESRIETMRTAPVQDHL